LIEAGLPSLAAACGFEYDIVFDPEGATGAGAPRGIDEELILTRYPVLASEVTVLYSALDPFFNRHVLRARIDHPVGPVDVYTTHLASSSDAGSAPCGVQIIFPVACPAECDAFVDTVRECQAKQLALLVEATHNVSTPAFITGDFNAEPQSNEYNEFTSRGWLDSHLAAGNDECDPVTGENCTGGGRDADEGDLEDPALNVDNRIDYIFVVPPGEGSSCSGDFVRVRGRRVGNPIKLATTGIFAGDPNPFEATCGPLPEDVCWPSDHSGNQVNLSCTHGP
jgi:endonuclease/exonuclease/phosphatase family metal-dependent hydrolase